MDARPYLDRIGYIGSTAPTPETLRLLHRAHLFSVPFENLDIARGRKIILDETAILRKIIEERRGGFCYELNGVFAGLLKALGFRVTLLSARFLRPDSSLGPDFDHLALRVDLDEPWLADVGFGDSFVDPLPLKVQATGNFRITTYGDYLNIQRQQSDDTWTSEYILTSTPRDLTDFADMCHYHQTSPDSHFTQNSVCTKATPNGRITLTNNKLIQTENGTRREIPVTSEEDWANHLQNHFGISP